MAHELFASLRELADIGVDEVRGGYSRFGFEAESELGAWFGMRASELGLRMTTDRNGNMWAWWGEPGPDAIVTGSHLDSVPGGGAFDGPLGVVSAFDAVKALQARGMTPGRPIAVVAFAEEEGSRFGLACLGSRLMTGQLPASRLRGLRDAEGEMPSAPGAYLAPMGEDSETLDRIGVFVELHIEQGRALADLDAPIAVASSILAHGRWRLSFRGEGNHAGATPMAGRRDPVVAASRAIVAARDAAFSRATDEARATVGRAELTPSGTNVIASRAELWLDARATSDTAARELVDAIVSAAFEVASDEGCELDVVEESFSGAVQFDPGLRAKLLAVLGDVPVLATGAGHDAGVLAAQVPTAMIFVRNPTGVSHAPEEWAEAADCAAGVAALTVVLESLADAR